MLERPCGETMWRQAWEGPCEEEGAFRQRRRTDRHTLPRASLSYLTSDLATIRHEDISPGTEPSSTCQSKRA